MVLQALREEKLEDEVSDRPRCQRTQLEEGLCEKLESRGRT